MELSNWQVIGLGWMIGLSFLFMLCRKLLNRPNA